MQVSANSKYVWANVKIPVHITSEEDIMNAFKDVLLYEVDFGLI